jgi:hypothetical protein
MISLHLNDGQTISFEIEEGAEWLAQLDRPDFQEKLTAVTVKMTHSSRGGETGVQYSVTRPRGFDGATLWFKVQRVEAKGRIHGGERLDLFVGDVRVSLTAHQSQPAARISITRIGRLKFSPSDLERPDA